MDKMIYTIGEVASLLGESVSCIRYWTNSFPEQLAPKRNAKGNRLYSPDDLEVLRNVQYLLKDKGLTIEGAIRQFADDTSLVERRRKAVESLKGIREALVEIRNSL